MQKYTKSVEFMMRKSSDIIEVLSLVNYRYSSLVKAMKFLYY